MANKKGFVARHGVIVNGVTVIDAAGNVSANALSSGIAADLATKATWDALIATNTAIRSVISTEVAALVDSAPGTLDTLNELAAALGDDASFAASTAATLATKASNAAFQSALANTNAYIATKLDSNGGTITGTVYGQSLIPTANNIYDLGSTEMVWRDVYIGPGSLYVNGTKVIEDDSDTIVVKADPDQSLTVKTTGTGETTLQSEGGVNITATGTSDIQITAGQNIELKSNVTLTSTKRIIDSAGTQVEFGDNIEMNGNKVTGVGTPSNTGDAATKGYVDTAITTLTNGAVQDNADDITSLTSTVSTNAATELSHLANTNSYIADTMSNARSLANARLGAAASVTLTGDVSGSGSFSSNAVSIAVTVADDSHNHTIANVDGLQTALDAKLASASYTASDVLGKVKTVDGSGSGLDADLLDGQEGSYYTGYTDTAIANLVDSAPGALDTLNELAAALGDDANFSTTVTNNLATKAATATTITAGTGLTGGGSLAANRTISLSHLGIQNLSDPNADRIMMWDDSAGAVAWMTAGTNLSISGTTMSSTDTNTTYAAGNGIALSGTTFSVAAGTGLTQNASGLALSHLGIQSLSDPGADRIMFWDDSAGTVTWLAPGSNMSISGTSLNSSYTDTNTTYSAGTGLGLSGTTFSLSHLGIQSLSDPNADRIMFWDDSAGAMAWLAPGSNMSISGTSLNSSYTDTNTTYAAGAGLDLSGTTFSLESDARGDLFYMGRDTNDYYVVNTTTHDWYLDGVLDMRLENDGDLHVDGNIVAYSTTTSSDRNLKDNIRNVENAIDKVKQLNGVEFEWKKDGSTSAGVIAQDVEQVLPQAVVETTDLNTNEAYKTVNYDALHAILIEAIKEQQKMIDELKAKIG